MTNTLPNRNLHPSTSGQFKLLREAPLKTGDGGHSLLWEVTTNDGVILSGVSEHPYGANPSQFIATLSPDGITLGQREKELGRPNIITEKILRLGISVVDILRITTPTIPNMSGNNRAYTLGREQRTTDALSTIETVRNYLGDDRKAGVSVVALHNLMSPRRFDPDTAFNNTLGINTREVITHANPYRRESFHRVVERYGEHLPLTKDRLNTPYLPPPDAFEL